MGALGKYLGELETWQATVVIMVVAGLVLGNVVAIGCALSNRTQRARMMNDQRKATKILEEVAKLTVEVGILDGVPGESRGLFLANVCNLHFTLRTVNTETEEQARIWALRLAASRLEALKTEARTLQGETSEDDNQQT